MRRWRERMGSGKNKGGDSGRRGPLMPSLEYYQWWFSHEKGVHILLAVSHRIVKGRKKEKQIHKHS